MVYGRAAILTWRQMMNERTQFSHMPSCTTAVLLQIRIPSNRGENILAFLPPPSLLPRLPLRLFLLKHRRRWHPSQRYYSRCFLIRRGCSSRYKLIPPQASVGNAPLGTAARVRPAIHERTRRCSYPGRTITPIPASERHSLTRLRLVSLWNDSCWLRQTAFKYIYQK
jgi:hypothetical protein